MNEHEPLPDFQLQSAVRPDSPPPPGHGLGSEHFAAAIANLAAAGISFEVVGESSFVGVRDATDTAPNHSHGVAEAA